MTLNAIPKFDFSSIDKFFKDKALVPGEKESMKGYKYFSEKYIHNIKITDLSSTLGQVIKVAGQCYHSQRKNESPHNLQVQFQSGNLFFSKCSCAIGLGGACGHIVGLLYTLSHYKMLGMESIPEDIPCTSKLQTWHQPRGPKIEGISIGEIEIRSQKKRLFKRKPITSTLLYNPVKKLCPKETILAKNYIDRNLITVFPSSVTQQLTTVSNLKCGEISSSCPLNFLLDHECHDIFPSFPVNDYMENNYHVVLGKEKNNFYMSLEVGRDSCVEIERKTREQSKMITWHTLRMNRITASVCGDIISRKKDFESLAMRLHSKKRFSTSETRRGLESESAAIKVYCQIKGEMVQTFPCGLMISYKCPYLAATPDQKVIEIENDKETYGLLEIKCPNPNTDFCKIKYLNCVNGSYKLKRNHKYYYQILMQMAISGCEWCDFFVYMVDRYICERLFFNENVWNDIKYKLDCFYFNYYL